MNEINEIETELFIKHAIFIKTIGFYRINFY